MASISETIVREYFEMHGFFVRQQRKFVGPSSRDENEADFYVINPQAQPANGPVPFVLESHHIRAVQRAVVVVKGWHTETFSPARLSHLPELFRFVQPLAFRQANRAFGDGGTLLKLLVVSALPPGSREREESIEFLRGKGIDSVIPFRSMLADLIAHIEANRNYQKSDVLQIIRILKNYEFIKEPQLELFKSRRRRKPRQVASKEE